MTTAHTGPARLLATLPRWLDRQPAEEVLVVGSGPHTRSHRSAVARISLADGAEPGLLWAACVTAVEAMDSAGADRLAIVVYSTAAADLDSLPAQVAATLTVLAEQRHLPVLDSLRVIGDRWWSYNCTDPSCCTPEGNPIPTPEEPRP